MATVGERREDWRGEEYVIRGVTALGASKAYRCPGCDQEVRRGMAHLVVWPASGSPESDRRHWHSTCWAARDRRSPGVQRSRSAPRY
ncbi:MAG: ATP/GTP-binding protein [Pseudonocardiales bacterium]|nr:MAG: ATP/GTP-binding protein [Pseudonocardiales bacterium]